MLSDEFVKSAAQVDPFAAYDVAANAEAYVGAAVGQGENPEISGQDGAQEVQFDEIALPDAVHIFEIRPHGGGVMSGVFFQSGCFPAESGVRAVGHEQQFTVDGNAPGAVVQGISLRRFFALVYLCLLQEGDVVSPFDFFCQEIVKVQTPAHIPGGGSGIGHDTPAERDVQYFTVGRNEAYAPYAGVLVGQPVKPLQDLRIEAVQQGSYFSTDGIAADFISREQGLVG